MPEGLPLGTKHTFATLDALRGAAAISVVLYHYRSLFLGPIALAAPAGGYLAVDLFFALSGFVIAYSYDTKLARLTLRDFAVRRLNRLLPMVWISVSAALIITAATTGLSSALIAVSLLNLALVPNLLLPSLSLVPINRPLWSLVYELIANLAYGLFWRWLTIRTAVSAMLLAAVVMSIYALTDHPMSGGIKLSTAPLGLARVTFSFLMGLILCRTMGLWRSKMPVVPWWLITACAVALLYVSPPEALRPAFDLLFIFLLSPLLIATAATNEPDRQSQPFAEWLARLSYPLYAIHMPIRDLVAFEIKELAITSAWVPLVAAALTIPIALISERFWDRPIRRKLATLTPKKCAPSS